MSIDTRQSRASNDDHRSAAGDQVDVSDLQVVADSRAARRLQQRRPSRRARFSLGLDRLLATIAGNAGGGSAGTSGTSSGPGQQREAAARPAWDVSTRQVPKGAPAGHEGDLGVRADRVAGAAGERRRLHGEAFGLHPAPDAPSTSRGGRGGRGGSRRAPVTTRRGKTALAKGIAAAGGGSTAFVPVPLEWRGTTRQVCGLFPWADAGQLPLIGAPIGRHQTSGAVVCFDHVSWFLGHRIANPSVLIIARPGLGKSTLSSKLMLWLAASGMILLVPGDTKPDYVALTTKLGGDHRIVARSGGAACNPCDPGGMAGAARRLTEAGEPAAGAALLAEAIGRATVCVSALLELGRKGPVADYEEAAISACLRELYERAAAAPADSEQSRPPLLRDVDELLGQRPAVVRDVVLDRGSDDRYDELVGPLQRSIRAALNGQYGDVFTRQVPRTDDRPPAVNIDTSRIEAGDPRFLAAVMIAAWSEMYGMVEADQALADARLAPRRRYCLTLDELWRVLRLGGTMPDRVNELTRLNRTQGVGQIMITHSIRDLAPGRNNDIEGLEERAGAIVIGGVPQKELDAIGDVVTLTGAEESALRAWWSTSSAALEQRTVPPGAGKFLIKASSEDPGIPVDVVLTSVERQWGGQNTNQAWHDTTTVVDVNVDAQGAVGRAS